jgi:hypothetical protein
MSLDQDFAFNQIIQVLDSTLRLSIRLDRLLYNFVQLSAVKELPTVRKDIIGPII